MLEAIHQICLYIRVGLRCVKESVDIFQITIMVLGWILEIFISNKLPSDVNAVDPDHNLKSKTFDYFAIFMIQLAIFS